jgi:hypothetical protein
MVILVALIMPFAMVAPRVPLGDPGMLRHAALGAMNIGLQAGANSSARDPAADTRDPGVANVLDFGADPSGHAPSDAAFTAAFRTRRKVIYAPAGTYLLSNAVRIPTQTELRGDGGYSTATTLQFADAKGGVMLGDGSSDSFGSSLRGIRVSGSGGTAVSVHRSWQAHVIDVAVSGKWTDGFTFVWTWGSTFEHLTTAGAAISHSCFTVGAAYNANVASNWYTASNVSQFNFLIDMSIGSVSGEASHGNHFSMLTAQGGVTGVYIRSLRDSVFSGIYTENVVHPVILGDRTAGLAARGLSINGASLGGPTRDHPRFADRDAVIHIDFADGITMSGIDFTAAYNIGSVSHVVISGGGGRGARAVARVTPAGLVHSVEVVSGGSGYTTPPSIRLGGAGKGATAAASVDEGRVTAIQITATGTGYVPAQVPAAIRYNRCSRVIVLAPYFDAGVGGSGPLYPFVVRTADALPSSGVQIIGELSLGDNTGEPHAAEFVKTPGRGFSHSLIETGADGTRFVRPYLAPAFP